MVKLDSTRECAPAAMTTVPPSQTVSVFAKIYRRVGLCEPSRLPPGSFIVHVAVCTALWALLSPLQPLNLCRTMNLHRDWTTVPATQAALRWPRGCPPRLMGVKSTTTWRNLLNGASPRWRLSLKRTRSPQQLLSPRLRRALLQCRRSTLHRGRCLVHTPAVAECIPLSPAISVAATPLNVFAVSRTACVYLHQSSELLTHATSLSQRLWLRSPSCSGTETFCQVRILLLLASD